MDIGEFHDVKEIGHGGMGVVYEGFYGNKKVAIKEIRHEYLSESELINRFRQEARILERLNHPSIVKIVKPAHYDSTKYYPAFECNGNLYLAMEFVEGCTLDKYIRNNGGPLNEEHAIGLMCRILDAMEYVRQQGLVHRDIKPSNIIIRPDNNVCIIDFGIVKDIRSNGMTTGRCVLGTNGYMSPEQAEGGLTIDSRTDIYSLGCVLFYMLTGVHAIQTRKSDLETRLAIIKESFPRAKDYNPLISDKIQMVIDRAVDKNMLKRFQSAREFQRELESENSTQISTDLSGDDIITVGRDSNCDIVVHDPAEKVSRRHMEISWKSEPEGVRYIFYDRSTNGSMVNEKYIKNDSCSVFVKEGKNGEVQSPVVILAGTVILDWADVCRVRMERQNDVSSTASSPATADRLSFWYGLLAIICPVAGWILYMQWKYEFPKKACLANKLAWISFIVGLISCIVF